MVEWHAYSFCSELLGTDHNWHMSHVFTFHWPTKVDSQARCQWGQDVYRPLRQGQRISWTIILPTIGVYRCHQSHQLPQRGSFFKKWGGEDKMKAPKRQNCQILMTDLIRSTGRWQVSRKRQEWRMTSRIPAWVTDEWILPAVEVENREGEETEKD